MVKMAIHLSCAIKDTLRSNSFFSELRWEYNAIEAFLECPEISQIATTIPQWESPLIMPTKYRNDFPAKEQKESILLIQGPWEYNHNINPKGWIFNCYAAGLDTEGSHKDFLHYLKTDYSGKYIFTTGWVGTDSKFDHLAAMVGEENVEVLPVPAVPNIIYSADHFNAKIILWPQKGITSDMQYHPEESKRILDWVASKLEQSPDLEFRAFSGLNGSIDSIAKEFFSFSMTEKLKSFANRITLYPLIDWSKVLEIYSQTKIIVSLCNSGGSALECGMYGIPFVGTSANCNPIKQANKFIFAEWASSDYLTLLEKLFSDHDCYRMIGDSYRDFTAKHYTYSAFCDKLLKILAKRNLL